jgi:hypothetical protein
LELPPKALSVLILLKRELLSSSAPVENTSATAANSESQNVIITLNRDAVKSKTTIRMRHARKPNEAFQRMCRRREFKF